MSALIKKTFDQLFEGVKFDKALAGQIYRFQINYINNNREHLEFFGGVLLGVHVVRFKDKDVSTFYESINVDQIDVEETVKTIDTINHSFIISSDPLNQTLFYITHRFLSSPLLNEKDRLRAAYDTILIFLYRSIAALISHGFRYPADPKIVQAAYSNLSNKYLIKKLGSWYKVMDYRAQDIASKQGLHYNTIKTYKDDLDIIKAINDTQGRIKDLFKNYYREIVKARDAGQSIESSSSTYTDLEGKEKVREKIDTVENYINYIIGVVADEHTFINNELVNVIKKLNTNTSHSMIRTTLLFMTENYSTQEHHNLIEDVLRKTIIHSFYLINNQLTPKSLKDYPYILTNLKYLYSSTRNNDPDMAEVRNLVETLIKTSNKRNINNSLLMSTRTAVILYITLRALVH